jgi:hypothetical protein
MPLRRIRLFALSLLIAAAAESGAAAGQTSAAPVPAQAPPSTAVPPPPSASPDKSPEKKIPVNPIAISFDASLDHDATDAKGPKVLKYVIEFVPVYSEGERKELDIGKPKPVDGQIVVSLKKVALKPGRYAVNVRARGRTGESPMSWVGPFDIVDPNAPPKPEAPAGHDHHDHGAPAKPPASTPPPTPPPPPTSPPASASPAPVAEKKSPDTAKPETAKPEKEKREDAQPADGKQKRGFWKKFYEKVVGSP